MVPGSGEIAMWFQNTRLVGSKETARFTVVVFGFRYGTLGSKRQLSLHLSTSNGGVNFLEDRVKTEDEAGKSLVP